MLNQQEISFNATTFSPCQLESTKCIFFLPENSVKTHTIEMLIPCRQQKNVNRITEASSTRGTGDRGSARRAVAARTQIR